MTVTELRRLITRAKTTACAAEWAGSLPPEEGEELMLKAKAAKEKLNSALTQLDLGVQTLETKR